MVPDGGTLGASSQTQQYDFFAEQTLKISVYFMQQIKKYFIFTFRQTDTFCIPTYMCRQDFFYMEIYTFHYTMFLCSLTLEGKQS